MKEDLITEYRYACFKARSANNPQDRHRWQRKALDIKTTFENYEDAQQEDKHYSQQTKVSKSNILKRKTDDEINYLIDYYNSLLSSNILLGHKFSFGRKTVDVTALIKQHINKLHTVLAMRD